MKRERTGRTRAMVGSTVNYIKAKGIETAVVLVHTNPMVEHIVGLAHDMFGVEGFEPSKGVLRLKNGCNLIIKRCDKYNAVHVAHFLRGNRLPLAIDHAVVFAELDPRVLNEIYRHRCRELDELAEEARSG